MTRLDLARTWTVARSATDAREVVERHLLATGLRVVAEDAASITAEGGSQLTARMIGIWFVNQNAYPRRVTITITDADGATAVRAVVEETLGFGVLDRWSRANYIRAFQAWLTALGGELGTPATQVTG